MKALESDSILRMLHGVITPLQGDFAILNARLHIGSMRLVQIFDSAAVVDYRRDKDGLTTGDNDRFLRLW